MGSVPRSTLGRLALAGATLALSTSCVLPGTAVVSSGHHGTAVAVKPPRISVTPADQSQAVPLDTPVVVSSSSGRLDTVIFAELGVAARPVGELSPDGSTWRISQPLDPGATYSVTAHATGATGQTASIHASFHTLVVPKRLLTSFAPDDGSVVGIGQPIALTFNVGIPTDRRAALLERIQVQSTPGTIGAWHWFADDTVHFRPKDFWPSGAQVKVVANLKGFNVGGGYWGLGSWSMSFSVGDKHVSVIDDSTHQMQVFSNDHLIATWPVSMGKSGFRTLSGTLVVLYRQYKVFMNSCTTFGGAACVPGAANFYADWVYYDTAISSDGYFIHSAPWSVYAQGHFDVSHGCVNLSPARATTFYNFSQTGDVVIVKNTGYAASAADGEGDWQIDFAAFSNTPGLETVWTGDAASAPPSGPVS